MKTEIIAAARYRLGSYLAVVGSALLFYFSTVFVRLGTTATELESSAFVTARFALGFALILVVSAKKRRIPIPKEYPYLVARILTNVFAVYCFFEALSLVGTVEANIVNMTYPVFIALLTALFWPSQQDWRSFFASFVAVAGIWLVFGAKPSNISAGSLWALASAVTASISIISLNRTRQLNDSYTVLFYLFGAGTVSMLFYDPPGGEFLELKNLAYLIPCAITAAVGQYALTVGLKLIPAVEGGIASSTRILFAASLGPPMAGDKPLVLLGWLGAVLIFAANVYVARLKAGSTAGNP